MYDSIQNFSSAEQKKKLRVHERVEGGPTYAEVLAGTKSPRSVTPEPNESLVKLKRELNSPVTPHKGGSKRVKDFRYNFRANLFIDTKT
jgi:hypothetical protein